MISLKHRGRLYPATSDGLAAALNLDLTGLPPSEHAALDEFASGQRRPHEVSDGCITPLGGGNYRIALPQETLVVNRDVRVAPQGRIYVSVVRASDPTVL